MKLMYPELLGAIELENKAVTCIVIENQTFMSDIVKDLYAQCSGFKGKSVLSVNEKPIEIGKNLEIIDNFFNFDINKKPIVTKIIKRINEIALSDENYADTMEFVGKIEHKLYQWVYEIPGDITFSNITPDVILKFAGIKINDDYVENYELAEKFIDYMEIVKEYDREKVFVYLNMRSYFSDEIMDNFIKTAISHNFKIILLDNKDNKILKYEKRITIDKELCLF